MKTPPESRKRTRRVRGERRAEPLELALPIAAPPMFAPAPPPAAPPITPTPAAPPVAATPAMPVAPPQSPWPRQTPSWPMPAVPARRASGGVRKVAIASAAVLGLFLVAFATVNRAPAPGGVAILPLRGLSVASDSLLGESFAEEMTTALTQVSGLSVRSSARTAEAVRASANPRDIGRNLSVGHLVEGSVLRDGRRMRVRLRLVRARDGETLWARALSMDPFDVMKAHDSVATIAVRELQRHLR